MQYALARVAEIIGARAPQHPDALIQWMLTDSRSLAFPETTLFFALRTALGDGHKYLPQLYRRGVRSFVVEAEPADAARLMPEADFLVVPSPLQALQRLAEAHRRTFDIPVVGITGSNGKTVVKEWLAALLAGSLSVTRSPRSYNSQIGVPLSVLLLDEGSQVGIFEAGISRPGEMAALRPIVRPTIGVMTCLGPAHEENFATPEEKCLEKLSLFRDAAVLVYNADDAAVAAGVEAMGYAGQRLAWSRRDRTCPLFVEQAERQAGGTRLRYVWQGNEHDALIPFTDDASVPSCIHCLAVCLHLGLDPAVVARRMARLEPVAMRLEVMQGVRGCTLINDAYNSDLASLDIALDFMHRRPAARSARGGAEAEARRGDAAVPAQRTTLILSDILQSSLAAPALYARVAQMAASRGVDRVVGVGPAISASAAAFPMEAHFFPTSEALVQSGLLDTLRDEVVLLKGARAFGFERVAERLMLRLHETTLEVNLAALAANLNYYRSFLRPGTRLTCMVKASAYGSGAVEVARTLQDRGVDYLAVAVADEGAELRRAGITTGIMVMNPEPSSFDTLFAYGLEPEVYSFGLLDALTRAAERRGVTGLPIHVKLDTGMHRLGFHPEDDVDELTTRLRQSSALVPRSVFSHFVGSDSPQFDAFSARQYARFTAAADRLQAAFSHHILRHICNSAGIERFPERQLDMVRLGLGLYGIDPIDNRGLNCVAALRTTLLQIRDVPAGDSVGYSRRTILSRPSRIAALPIGYADGLDRRLGNRCGYCLVRGQRAPYVGNICMDVCMVDVTDIDCREGDSVEVFGPALPVTELSGRLDTIPYEVLTSVSNRVRRVYFQE